MTEVWQELEWKITVAAKNGDVEMQRIKDKLPAELKYERYTREHIPSGITVNEPTLSNDGKEITWITTWTLKSWNYIELHVISSVEKMPKKTVENVACAKPIDPEEEECWTWHTYDLRIQKHILDENWNKVKAITWNENDIIRYIIDFWNNGDESVFVILKDYLPKWVEFMSGELVVWWASTAWEVSNWNLNMVYDWETINVQWIDINTYSGVLLKPNQSWTLTIVGKIKPRDEKESTTNFACIFDDKGNKIDCDDAHHNIEPKEVLCKKPTLNPSTFKNVCPDNNTEFSTTVECESTWWEADIEILCDGKSINSGHTTQLTWTCPATTNNTDHKVQCIVNWSYTWVNWEVCEGFFRRNTDENCNTPPPTPSCFVAGTKVVMADGSEKNIEDVKIWEKVLWSNWSINTVLWYDRPVLWGRHLWSINGSEYFVSDEHPFKTTEWWKSFNPEMTKIEVDLDTTELKVWDILITANGLEEIRSVDYINADYNTPLYNFVLDGDHTYYANNYLVHNKWWKATPPCKDMKIEWNDVTCYAEDNPNKYFKWYFKLECGDRTYYSYNYRTNPQESAAYEYTFENVNCEANNLKCSVSKYEKDWPWTSNKRCVKATVPEWFEQCFNVNAGNFSIEEWEIFPFYWNMHNLEVWIDENKEGDVDWYTTISNTSESYKNAQQNLSGWDNKECGQDKFWKIAKDSMVCTFKIYWWWEQNPLYTIQWPCLSKEGDNPLETGLIWAWYSKMKAIYCQSSNCYFSLDPNRDDDRWLLPSAVYYIQKFWTGATIALNGEPWEWNWDLQWNLNKEKNKPYWEYRIVMDSIKYLQCIGDGEENNYWQVQSPTDYFVPCQNNFVLTDPYTVQKTPSGNLTASTEKLSKYKYLSGTAVFSDLLNAVQTAVYEPNAKVNEAMDTFIKKYEKLAVAVNGVSKLQWGGTIKKVPGKDIYFVEGTITIKGWNNNIKNPFTIVQTAWDTIVEWDINHNMMLLTKWNIKFKWDCEHDQTVKGIYYASGSLSRTSDLKKNTNPWSSVWCTKGWLHVKWVLIWWNFNNLMNASRSHLNDWFNKEDKKWSVMNWASVLIEYSPSIFTKSTMPPGAEDFTTALSIYKK